MSWAPINANPVVRAAFEPALPFRVRVSHAPAWDRLTLEGELDLASAPILQAELDRLECDPASVIVVDLHRLSFIDAAGMRVLLQAHERALLGWWSVVIVRGPRPVQRVFELTGVEQVIHLIDDPALARPERLRRIP